MKSFEYVLKQLKKEVGATTSCDRTVALMEEILQKIKELKAG